MTKRHFLGMVLLVAVWVGNRCPVWGASAPSAPPNSKPRLELTVNSRKITHLSGADFDNQRQSVGIKIKVVSQDKTQNLQGLKAELYAMGKDIATKAVKLLGSTVLEFELPAGGTYSGNWQSEPYEFDETLPVLFGAKYQGHLVVIKDGNDQILATNATKPDYLKLYEQLKSEPNDRKKGPRKKIAR